MNNSLSLDGTRSQWLDFGYHTNACFSQPDICGAAGGAVSFWINVNDCSDWQGIISSQPEGRAGLVIFCHRSILGYYSHT